MVFDPTISLEGIFVMGASAFAICGSMFAFIRYFQERRKSRNLETLKYMSQVRKEIWDLLKKYNVSQIRLLPRKHEVRQKLEYISAAVNIGTIDYKVMKKNSGNWLCSAIKDSDILDTNEMEYRESKNLYRKLKGIE